MSPPVSAMAGIATAQVADACVRLGIPVRVAPPGIRPLDVSMAARGRALPVSHHGSVDIFLEALQASVPGDVLVIDNQARTDEGCIGDLTVIEAQACGIAGVVLWGCHRDSLELIRVGLPVFSYGSCPKGPTRGDTRIPSALESAWFGEFTVTETTSSLRTPTASCSCPPGASRKSSNPQDASRRWSVAKPKTCAAAQPCAINCVSRSI